ncbi:cytochrome P450 [Xanthomonas euvesicatoria]|uniref:cytochrome P450 n=1 Tax=Xanthomonas euvesicatoria TaxID=456327 RepID=UPI001E3BD90A|nr:cytochrome P450 [Xanthomonas euvesicatoria]
MQQPLKCTSAELQANPQIVFARLRPLTPVLQRDDGLYVAIRAQDVQQLLVDPRTRQMETEIATARGVTDGPLLEFLKHTMVLSNGTAHRNRRLPLVQAFASRFVQDVRPYARRVAEQLIDARYDAGAMDVIGDFASWLPARVICHILELPETDIPAFTRCVYSLSRAFNSTFTPDEVPELQQASGELDAYVRGLIAHRRRHPREDFITSYIAASDASGQLSQTEVVAQLMSILLAGSDTTRSALAIQTSLLLQHPEQWQAVCRDSALIPAAVRECLRYQPAVASVPRITLEDVVLDETLVPAGKILSLSTLSALRDPALYAEPEHFDIHRTDAPKRQLVFGGGVHRCLGEALAMIELEEGLAAMAQTATGHATRRQSGRGPGWVRHSDGARLPRQLGQCPDGLTHRAAKQPLPIRCSAITLRCNAAAGLESIVGVGTRSYGSRRSNGTHPHATASSDHVRPGRCQPLANTRTSAIVR